MFLARIEGAPLSKAYKSYVVERRATDNAVQKLYLEAYLKSFTPLCYPWGYKLRPCWWHSI